MAKFLRITPDFITKSTQIAWYLLQKFDKTAWYLLQKFVKHHGICYKSLINIMVFVTKKHYFV